MPLQIALLVPA